VNSVQHIAFNCRDRAATEAFYAKHFGFRRVRTFKPGAPDEFVMLRLGETCVELFPAAQGTGEAGGEQQVGFKHLAFEVPDLEAAVAALNADGLETGEVINSSEVPGLRVCFFNDPDGNRIELMHGYSDEV
jgi:glyoxylase I family protein